MLSTNDIFKRPAAGKRAFPRALLGLLFVIVLLFDAFSIRAAEVTEHQVKALCLLNFAKYVSWPEGTLAGEKEPFRIGILDQDKIARELKNAAVGKKIAGRSIVVTEVKNETDWSACHILFVGDASAAQTRAVIEAVKSLPVLTVGEDGDFSAVGGVINFVKKENKVRFEISLDNAQEANLQISSKLLSLADVVHGKK